MDRSQIQAFRVLGIPTDSEPEAMVRAYRRLARSTHPDVSSDPDAAGRFARVAAAYRLLSQNPPEDSVRVHEPASGEDGSVPGQVPVDEAVQWGPPRGGGWVTIGTMPLPHEEPPPIVAGPAWVTPLRRRDDLEVPGG